MNTDETKKTVGDLVAPPDYANVAIRIRLDHFLEFSARMTEQLDQLVARWAHRAAPRAQRFQRRHVS